MIRFIVHSESESHEHPHWSAADVEKWCSRWIENGCMTESDAERVARFTRDCKATGSMIWIGKVVIRSTSIN